MPIDHKARARKAWPILVSVASARGEPMSYSELAAQLDLHYRAVGRFLGVIQMYCKKQQWPPLQALVVNKRTKLPGGGYTGSGRGVVQHQAALQKVRAYNWPVTVPF